MSIWLILSCVLVLGLLVLIVLTRRPKQYQKEVFSEHFKVVNISDLQIRKDNDFLKDALFESKLFYKYPVGYQNRFGLEGNVEGIQFQFVELKSMEYSNNSKDHRKNPEVFQFKGIFVKFHLKQKLDFELFLHPDYLERFLGFIGRGVQDFGEKLLLIEHSNKQFEKKFKILTDDRVKADHFLTESLVKKVLEVRTNLNRSMSLALHGDCVYVTIPSYFKILTKGDIDNAGSLNANGEAERIVKVLHSIISEINQFST